MSIYAPNVRAFTFIKVTLLKLKAHIVPHTIIVGDVKTALSSMGGSWGKNYRDTVKLKQVMNQMDLTCVYRPFYPKTKEYTFFSETHSTVYNNDHIIGHKRSLNRYKKIEIIPLILSDHHRLRLFFN
jgi:exonuclease III